MRERFEPSVPSLRLGYFVLPPDLVERFAAVRRAMDLCLSYIPQAVMFEGHFARHLRRMQPIYAERRRALVAAVEREFGQNAEIMGDAADMHLALMLKKPGNDQAIAALRFLREPGAALRFRARVRQ